MKNFSIKLLPILLIFATFTISSCEKDCDECIAAQKHYYSNLLTYGCQDILQIAPSKEKVRDACNNGSAKAAAILSSCQNGYSPSFTCD